MMTADELDGLVAQLRCRGYCAATIMGIAGEHDPDVSIVDVLDAFERETERTGIVGDDLVLLAELWALCAPADGPNGEPFSEQLARMAAGGDARAQRLIDEAAAEELHAMVRRDFEDRVRRGEADRILVAGRVTFRLRRAGP